MDLKAGTMITEEVRLISPLERATSGRVWLADQLDWRKKVVVKVLDSIKKKEDSALERFLEAAAQAQEIESDRLARVFDFGVSDDFTPYVVMEHLRGEALDARLRKKDRLSPKDAGEVVSQVAQALAHSHILELYHHALAPDAVFLVGGKQLDVKVLGFGTACLAPIDRASEFIAPEQYLGKAADHTADLWSLGALAYLTLTGQVPIDVKKRRLMQWDFEAPSDMWLTDVPPEVDAWFEKALHKDPTKRFESADAMADSFAELMPGLEHLVSSQAKGAGIVKVVEVGMPVKVADKKESEIVLDEMTDDSPGITIDVDE